MGKHVKQLSLLLPVLALLAAALACNAPGVGNAQPIAAPTPTVAGPAPANVAATAVPGPTPGGVEPTTVVDPTAACPAAGEGTVQFISREDGFCLIYPSFLSVPEAGIFTESLALIGPPADPNAMESAVVFVTVAYNGPAEGMTSLDYARQWRELYGGEMASEPMETTIGGVPAAVIDNAMEGMFSQRRGFVVVGDARYTLSLLPQPGDVPALVAQSNQAWDTIAGSLVFFPPEVPRQVVKPDDVCPTATADALVHIDLELGVCMLYPASFELDTRFSSGFVGGPVVGELEGIGPIRPNLVVGPWGPVVEGQTPRDVIEPRLPFVDPASLQDIVIGGAPAVTFLDLNGAVISRQALIVARGQSYTILVQPYDPQQYPDAIPYADQVWNTVTGSMAFFDVWK